MVYRLTSCLGILVLLSVAFANSEDPTKVRPRTVLAGVGLQLFLGLIILRTDIGLFVFDTARNLALSILSYTQKGSEFIFGPLANFGVMAEAFQGEKNAFVFATMVLPTIIFVSSLMSILYHLGVMQKIVRVMAKIMMIIMGTSGAESLAAAANVFVGQTEAPLVVRPYIDKMTRSELMALMTGGMATVAGGVMAAYVGMGIDAGHLLSASVMSAPAALVCAKILCPEGIVKGGQELREVDEEKRTENIIDAAALGAGDGLKLALNVGAMLLAFIALVALANGTLLYLGELVGIQQLSLQVIMGYLFSPIAWFMGVDWSDAVHVGQLLGQKLILNEFVAYIELANMKDLISERAYILSTYALCGFANFSSVAIQVGGIATLAPGRRRELASLGMKSLLGGTLACLMTACVAGIFI